MHKLIKEAQEQIFALYVITQSLEIKDGIYFNYKFKIIFTENIDRGCLDEIINEQIRYYIKWYSHDYSDYFAN